MRSIGFRLTVAGPGVRCDQCVKSKAGCVLTHAAGVAAVQAFYAARADGTTGAALKRLRVEARAAVVNVVVPAAGAADAPVAGGEEEGVVEVEGGPAAPVAPVEGAGLAGLAAGVPPAAVPLVAALPGLVLPCRGSVAARRAATVAQTTSMLSRRAINTTPVLNMTSCS